MKTKLTRLLAYSFMILCISCNRENNQTASSVKADSLSSKIKIDSIETLKTKVSPRDAEDFEVFIKYFLTKLYYKDNFDQSMYKSNPDFVEFTSKELPVGRFSAPGIYTILKDAPYFDSPNDFKTTNINLEKTEIIGNKLPKDGICEPSNLKDAIYYKVVKEAPIGYDIQNDRDGKYPRVLKGLKIMQVEIQVDKMLERLIFFAFYKGKWYFIYLDDSPSCGV
jgi:hypothetical protein